MSPIIQALYVLVSTAFSLYILVVLLRFILQVVRADFYNPISQFIVKVTNPVVVPLRRFVPGFGGIDMATVLLLMTLLLLEVFVLRMLKGYPTSIPGLLVLGVSTLLIKLWYLYFATIIIQVIMSWVNSGGYNPAMSLIYSINEPILRPAQRAIPPIQGFDLSPIVVFVALQIIWILIIAPLDQYGNVLAIQGYNMFSPQKSQIPL